MFQQVFKSNILKTITCNCREFDVRDNDYREKPEEDLQIVHECDNIIVYQQRKGFKRFYKTLI